MGMECTFPELSHSTGYAYGCRCDGCRSYKANKERNYYAKQKEDGSTYYQRNREAIIEKRKRHRDEQPEKIWAAKLPSTTGITVEEYEALFEAQKGKCAICGNPPNGKRLAVDHDHSCCPGRKSCGQCVRGLLCNNCNNGLGRFQDDYELLVSAVQYLTKGN